MLLTFRADHWPGAPPLSPCCISSLTSSLSLGSVYLFLGGIFARYSAEEQKGRGVVEMIALRRLRDLNSRARRHNGGEMVGTVSAKVEVIDWHGLIEERVAGLIQTKDMIM